MRRKNETASGREQISVRGQLHGFSKIKEGKDTGSDTNRKKILRRTMTEGTKKLAQNKTRKLPSLEEKEPVLSTNSYMAKPGVSRE